MSSVIFDSQHAWFSSSVSIDYTNCWVKYGGKIVDQRDQAQFLFSLDKTFQDTACLYDTDEFRKRRLTVFDPKLILHAKDERSLCDIDLGKYILNTPKETEDFTYKVYHRIGADDNLSSVEDSSDVHSADEVFIAKRILLRNKRKQASKLPLAAIAKEASSSTTSTSKSRRPPRYQATRARLTRKAKAVAKKKIIKKTPIMPENCDDFTFPENVVIKDIVHIDEITIADPQVNMEYFIPNCNKCMVIGKGSSSLSS
ncbi:Telomere repeats-binding bouquet formation protein 2 [Trichoplax sp. H2]|nr:Telomere repeats-binding bouquet formation protein 2 [Trichoplax sp. H2]|eukprot:RDD36590.1 Telomere repeats-binding bouquet formation protein 2 [Trichoplax sp. H2]